MNALAQTVEQNLVLILIVIVVVLTGALIWLVILNRGLAAQRRVFDRLTRGVQIGNIEEVLLEHIDEMRSYADRVSQLETRADSADASLRGCIRHVGVVRFDAFENVGGQQSFACALLDDDRSGIVLSGIYSRSDVRVYAKHVVRGISHVPLTAEEGEAVKQAMSGPAP